MTGQNDSRKDYLFYGYGSNIESPDNHRQLLMNEHTHVNTIMAMTVAVTIKACGFIILYFYQFIIVMKYTSGQRFFVPYCKGNAQEAY